MPPGGEVFNITTGSIDYYNGSSWISILGGLSEVLKDPTGFRYPSDIVSSYDPSARTVTLTGDLTYYVNGQKKMLVSPWTSSAHPATEGAWYLSDSGGGPSWSQVVWDLSFAQFAMVYYGTVSYGVRETHGLMSWTAHQVVHDTSGLYKVSGLGATGYLPAPDVPTDAGNMPSFSAGVVRDEDLQTSIQPLIGVTGAYTHLLVDAVNNPTMSTGNSQIVPGVSGMAAYNKQGVLTQVPSGSFSNVFDIVIPAMADSGSQLVRHVFLPGASVYSTADLARTEDYRSQRLENLPRLLTESVPANLITIKSDSSYASTNKFRIESIQPFSIQRVTAVPPAATTSAAVTGAGDQPTYSITVSNYEQAVTQLVWTTMAFLAQTAKFNYMAIFCTQSGNGNTRIGVYDSNHTLLAQTVNSTSLSNGFNVLALTSEIVLPGNSYYYFAVQSRANGARIIGYNATVNPNTPVLARMDSSNGADPLNGMSSTVTVSQSQYRLWSRLFYQ
jgi:hypothetical protein